MNKKILILGAGFGGLDTALNLRKELDDSYTIELIDKSEYFIIGFTKFDVMFGRRTAEDVKSYYKDLAIEGVNFIHDEILLIDPEQKNVKTVSGEFGYDYLVVALGADTFPDAIPGFVEGGYEFYSLKGGEKLYTAIDNFRSGTIVISIFSKPYKCPPAPYEAAFQLDEYFKQKGVRDDVNIKVLIPSPIPLPIAPNVSERIEELLTERNIELYSKHKVTELDIANKSAVIENREPMPYDLFIGIPIHKPPKVIRESALGNGGWISISTDNLETPYENVYAIGDVTNVPVGEFAVPKSGALAENGAEVVVSDILSKIKGEESTLRYEGIGTCFVELGEGMVGKLNTNFLGKPEPEVSLEGPTVEFKQDKIRFEKDRIEKWFGVRQNQ
ncbi:MAG: FAD-dependent oxidoreductase [Candidatus Marinimicrobia bacterium]|nr:FAD-dependent oxidoreductase [Candidatus Neomarinimicrobiota bacterium]